MTEMTSETSTRSPPPTSSAVINDDKLSGQLIIKAQLGDDIRKMMIHNEDLTLNELVLMMERVFSGKISNSDELTIKYLDDDGDKITLLNDSDLTVALNFHKILRLFVFVNGNEQLKTNSTDNLKQEENLIDAKTFRNELQSIRNSVQTILDRLQLSKDGVEVVAPPPPPPTITTPTVSSSTTREFDPFKQQQQSATPDTNQSNSNHITNNNNNQAAATVDTQHVTSTDNSSSTFQQMPTPHFTPSGFNNEQQARANVFGPPPTTTAYPAMPSLPNATAPRFSPTATTPNGSAPSSFLRQQAPSPPTQGGFYGQQQNLYQQRPPTSNYNPTNTFVPQQTGTPPSNSSPATINPSYSQSPPPPMAAQQPYGGYPPQNSYYNPVQQYPKTS